LEETKIIDVNPIFDTGIKSLRESKGKFFVMCGEITMGESDVMRRLYPSGLD